MSEHQTATPKQFTPDQLIIDGTEHVIQSPNSPCGNRIYYEIEVGQAGLTILLPLTLFYLVGTLAMTRDIAPDGIANGDETGFIHRSRLGLYETTIKQSVYRIRTHVRQQANVAYSLGRITNTDHTAISDWPVLESRKGAPRMSYWRCAVGPEAIQVNCKALDFPVANFRRFAVEYFRRHKASTKEVSPSCQGNFS